MIQMARIVSVCTVAAILLFSQGCSGTRQRSESASLKAPPPTDAAVTELARVDPPPEQMPRISMIDIQGLIISRDWTSNGRYAHFLASEPLRWPEIAGDAESVELATAQAPMSASIRYFLGPLSDSGVPTTDPVIVECVTGNAEVAEHGCRYGPSVDGFRITFMPPAHVQAVIANIAWYVPTLLRDGLPDAPPVNIVAVGWKLVRESAG